MKQMIILQGAAKKRKTSTLRFLEEILNVKKINSNLIKGTLAKNHDFVITFEVNGKTIAIVSAGDNIDLKKDLENLYQKHHIDILFGASRTKGVTRKIIYDISKKHNINVIRTTTYNSKHEDEHNSLNKLKAEQLKELLVRLKLI